jgi:Cdc6-like AAA superfamily ATPase
MQFIQRLTKDLGEKIGVAGLDRRVVANESISFRDLNRIIADSGRPVAILIRHAERLVEMRKQILLYNLLDWMTTEVNRMVGLVFTTRLVFFVDRLEKRVKSRLDATKLTVVRPEAGNMLGLLVRRVECLMEDSKGDKASW